MPKPYPQETVYWCTELFTKALKEPVELDLSFSKYPTQLMKSYLNTLHGFKSHIQKSGQLHPFYNTLVQAIYKVRIVKYNNKIILRSAEPYRYNSVERRIFSKLPTLNLGDKNYGSR